MPDYILFKAGNKGWQTAAESELPDEATLQTLIRENPEVLPFDDLGEGIPPLLVVGREVSLLNGYADVVAVDQDGLVTIIECKLDRNPEVKRTVVGQILSYGAYLWQMSYEQFESEIARKYLTSPLYPRKEWSELPLDEVMDSFHAQRPFGETWDRDTFRNNLASNLKRGRFRLVIVVDKVNDELRRTIEYLNQCTGPNFDCLCAELRYFATSETELLVPALIGVPSVKQSLPERRQRQWDETSFFSEIEKKFGVEQKEALEELHSWAKDHYSIGWGSGAVTGSMIPFIPWHNDRLAVPFTVYTNGYIEINFDYLSHYPVFESDENRKSLLAKLNSVKGIELPPEKYSKRPSVNYSQLLDPQTFTGFTKIMEEVASELVATKDLASP